MDNQCYLAIYSHTSIASINSDYPLRKVSLPDYFDCPLDSINQAVDYGSILPSLNNP